jgi:hypothetical protein
MKLEKLGFFSRSEEGSYANITDPVFKQRKWFWTCFWMDLGRIDKNYFGFFFLPQFWQKIRDEFK